MAHEFPAAIERGLDDAGIGFADNAVHGHGRRDAEALEASMETPKPDAHAVFVPGPIGEIGDEGLA